MVELLKKGEKKWRMFTENKEKAVFIVEGAFNVTLMSQQLYIKKEKQCMNYLTIHIDERKGANLEISLEKVHLIVRSILEDKLEGKKFTLAFKCTCEEVKRVPHLMNVASHAKAMCQNASCPQKLEKSHLRWFVS